MKIEERHHGHGYSSWFEWGAKELAFLGKREALQECEEILKALFRVSRSELYLAKQVDQAAFPQFSEWVQSRKKRIPLAYLLRKVHFWEDDFEIEEGVFIPRPETESLIGAFLNTSGFSKDKTFRFLDLGTGTGNIAVTIAKLFPHSRGVACDISPRAMELCGRNALQLGVRERLHLIQTDGLLAFADESFNVIFSNPPYIASSDWDQLDEEVLQEPREALEGGEEGLDFYRKIFQELSCLKAEGGLWVEIGWGQTAGILSLFGETRFRHRHIFKDLNQIDRVICGKGLIHG